MSTEPKEQCDVSPCGEIDRLLFPRIIRGAANEFVFLVRPVDGLLMLEVADGRGHGFSQIQTGGVTFCCSLRNNRPH